MDMVVADLERANTRAATVERRNVNIFFLVGCRLVHVSPRNSCVPRLNLLRLVMTRLTGNCTASNYYTRSHRPLACSVHNLESQVTSLESEVDRLSQSLNAQRAVAHEAETNARKAAEEHARASSTNVCNSVIVKFRS